MRTMTSTCEPSGSPFVVAELAAAACHVHEGVGVALRAGEFLGGDVVRVGVVGAPADLGEPAQFVLEERELVRWQQATHAAHAVLALEGGDTASAALRDVTGGAVVACGSVRPAAQEPSVGVGARGFGRGDQILLLVPHSGGNPPGCITCRIGEVHRRIDAEVHSNRSRELGQCLGVPMGDASVGERLAHHGQLFQAGGGAGAGQRLAAAHTGTLTQPGSGVHRPRLAGRIRPIRHADRSGLAGVHPRAHRPHCPQVVSQPLGAQPTRITVQNRQCPHRPPRTLAGPVDAGAPVHRALCGASLGETTGGENRCRRGLVELRRLHGRHITEGV